ncbi:MAG: Mce-associated rane protein [Mycobacterium sp.]|jgi:Mce-associated membrane protein|nr:Mce-associated rane protein [Mycobacterium sp.]MDT5319331.1 Mce-associated rane protein [Mycobacterium sp.]
MRKPQLGNRRVPSQSTRKGAIPVRVATETETVTGEDAVEVSAETTEPSATEIDEPEDAVDVVESEDASSDDAQNEDAEDVTPPARWRRIKWSRVLAFGVLPLLAVGIAAGAGFLKWQDGWVRGSRVAGIESVAAAKDSTIALLSYQPDTVDKELKAARDRLTGSFKDSYTQLIQDVVIPGAKKQHISAVATVPAAASVSATPKHAVALLYVDQTVVVGNDAPTDTSSIVRVTLDRTGGRWLISGFDPI